MKLSSAFKCDLIAVAVLAAAAYKLTFALANVMDIDPTDETLYLSNGLWLLSQGLPQHDYSPLYAIWYFILSCLESDPLRLYYFNYQVLAVLLPILLFSLLRRLNLSTLAALVISAYFMISEANLPCWPKSCHFAIAIILLFLILSTFMRSLILKTLCLALGALVGTFARPELFLAMVLLTVLYIVLLARNLRQIRLSYGLAALVLLVIVSVVLVSLIVIPMFDEHERAFMAFGQAFAINWVGWSGDDVNPWADFYKVTSEKFGPVESIFAAFASNPMLFLKHVGYNAIRTPIAMAKLIFVHYNIILPINTRPWWGIEGGLLLALGLLYVVLTLRRSFPNVKNAVRERGWLLLQCALLCVPGFVASTVMFPRLHYLALPSLLILVMLAVSLLQGAGRRAKWSDVALVGVLIVALTPCVSQCEIESGLLLKGTMVNVRTIELIRSLEITESVNLLNTEGRFHVYAGGNYRWIMPRMKKGGFREFLDEYNVNMILVTWRLRTHTLLGDDKDWQFMLEDPGAFGFEKMDVPGTARCLLVRRDLLHGT